MTSALAQKKKVSISPTKSSFFFLSHWLCEFCLFVQLSREALLHFETSTSCNFSHFIPPDALN